jgi:hypothetical protein
VVLRMPTEPADLEFWLLVVDEERSRHAELPIDSLIAYFSPSWTAFQAERGRDFSLIVDGISN